MKPKNKIAISVVICLLAVGFASATIFVKKTAAAYCGACDSLNGFPGVLQRVGFVPRGTCPKLKTSSNEEPGKGEGSTHGKKPLCVPHFCEVQGKKGHCVARAEPDLKHFNCFCEPNKISH